MYRKKHFAFGLSVTLHLGIEKNEILASGYCVLSLECNCNEIETQLCVCIIDRKTAVHNSAKQRHLAVYCGIEL